MPALIHPPSLPEVAVPKMRSGRYYISSDSPDLRCASDTLMRTRTGEVVDSLESPGGGALPRGFWFSVGGSVFQMNPWEIKRYFYEVKLARKIPADAKEIFTLPRKREITAFMEQFGSNPFSMNGGPAYGDGIEWERVVQQYDGMIVLSYPRLRPVPAWYNALGCPRGVVWKNLNFVELRRLSKPPTALGIVPNPDIGEGEEV